MCVCVFRSQASRLKRRSKISSQRSEANLRLSLKPTRFGEVQIDAAKKGKKTPLSPPQINPNQTHLPSNRSKNGSKQDYRSHWIPPLLQGEFVRFISFYINLIGVHLFASVRVRPPAPHTPTHLAKYKHC